MRRHLGILVFRTPMTTPFMILQFVPPKSSFLEEEGGSTEKKIHRNLNIFGDIGTNAKFQSPTPTPYWRK